MHVLRHGYGGLTDEAAPRQINTGYSVNGSFAEYAPADPAYVGHLLPSRHNAAPPLRDRKFVDSSVEGSGFELPVPRCALIATPMRSATSHNLFKPCPSPARWRGSKRRRRRAEPSCGAVKRPPMPRNARNGAEIRGFCAAVPKVRIHLPPPESLRTFGS
jgi:hypothetical protein